MTSYRNITITPEVQQIIKSLRSIFDSSNRYLLSKENVEQHKEFSKTLSSMLPKITVTSVCEIDDILFPNEDLSVDNVSDTLPEELRKYLIENCYKLIHDLHESLTNKNTYVGILDATYLQLIEHSTHDIFGKHHQSTMCIAKKFIAVKKPLAVCLGLKYLTLAIHKHPKITFEDLQRLGKLYVEDFFVLLKKLMNVTQTQHPKSQRITAWIANQSAAIFEKLQAGFEPKLTADVNETLKLFYESKYDADYIRRVRRVCCRYRFIDHMYRYFSSAKNEDEIIKEFFYGLYKSTQHCLTTEEAVLSMTSISSAIIYLLTPLLKSSSYSNDFMKEMDKKHRNDLEPYISETDSSSTTAEAEKDQKVSDALKDSLGTDEEPDFSLEKYFFYENFLKALYVLWRMHEACLKCKELMKTEGDIVGCEGSVFRLEWSGILKIFADRIANPSSGGDMTWWIYTLLKKCPFLVLSKDTEHMIGDLIKIMEGKEMETSTLESLYFAVVGSKSKKSY